MYSYARRYHLNSNLRLLANFRQIDKLVVHYLSTTYATIQSILGQHYRNHRRMGTRKYLLTFQSSRNPCVYCLVAVRIGCQDRTGIRFYLQDTRNDHRFPVEKASSSLLTVNPAMEKLRKYPAVLFYVLCPSFD